MNWINRTILVPASLLPCAIEEKLILESGAGKEKEGYETKVADKEGFTTRYPGRVSLIDLSREASTRMEFEP